MFKKGDRVILTERYPGDDWKGKTGTIATDYNEDERPWPWRVRLDGIMGDHLVCEYEIKHLSLNKIPTKSVVV